MDTVPVEVHEALKTAMDKLQVSKASHIVSALLHCSARLGSSVRQTQHKQIAGE